MGATLPLRTVIAKYKNREISTGKAAEMAGVSISRFLDLLRENNVHFNYTLKELEEDMKGFEGMFSLKGSAKKKRKKR